MQDAPSEADPQRRPRLTPPIADTRRAVREGVLGLPPDALVLVALSGGADSLALAAATAFEAPRAGLRAGAVVIDHGLQHGSADAAERAAAAARDLGLHPVLVRHVEVGTEGGPEAAARDARYAELEAVAAELDAAAVLIGHTLDDQAETVLLGLARGSGPGSLRGMAAVNGLWRRPFLGIHRAETAAACHHLGLTFWRDPQNDDPAFARVRVRESVLPLIELELGPGIAEALARTAEQLREDDDALDQMVEEVAEDLAEHIDAGIALPAAALVANPPAIRHRLIRLAAHAEFGVSLSRAQTLEVARLATHWRGQGEVHLPGIRVDRVDGLIRFVAAI